MLSTAPSPEEPAGIGPEIRLDEPVERPSGPRRAWLFPLAGAGAILILAATQFHGKPEQPPPIDPCTQALRQPELRDQLHDEAAKDPRCRALYPDREETVEVPPSQGATVARVAPPPQEGGAEWVTRPEDIAVEPTDAPSADASTMPPNVLDSLKKAFRVLGDPRTRGNAAKAALEEQGRTFASNVDVFSAADRTVYIASHFDRTLGAAARIDVAADPYAAARLVRRFASMLAEFTALAEADEEASDAMKRMFNTSDIRVAGKVAYQLGDIGEAIVEAKDEERYPLARVCLEAAREWDMHSADGEDTYAEVIGRLEGEADKALRQALRQPDDEKAAEMKWIQSWAPSGQAAQAQALSVVEEAGDES